MEKATDSAVWTVSQLTRRVKGLLEETLGAVWVSGEISNWKSAASGHAYFTLKDENSQIDAVMFRGSLGKIRFEPENGLEILAHGRITVYERRGNYQIVLDDMQPKGLGALQLAFEKLKAKLSAEGLFDAGHKQPLPLFPRRIGIVTSPTGAAIRDMLNILGRRFANAHVLVYPARVQGKQAAPEIVEGIRALDDYGVDVIIVGRGGGSLEDLWPFNEEIVVRAVYAARTPVISAVGHEVDFTLTDFAADLRAPTPSAAAELVVQEREALLERIQARRKRLAAALLRHTERARHRLKVAQQSPVFRRPEELVRQKRQRCDEMGMRMADAIDGVLHDSRMRLERAQRALGLLSPSARVGREAERLRTLQMRWVRAGNMVVQRERGHLMPLMAQLNALSPLAILSRGYALAWKEPAHTLVRDGADLAAGNDLELRFGRGGARVMVTSIVGEEHA